METTKLLNGSAKPGLSSSAPFRNLRVAAVIFLIVGAYLFNASVLREPNQDYCIVIDAGSSGTRLHVMSWNVPETPKKTPITGADSPEQLHLPPVEEWSGLGALPSRKQRAQGKAAYRKETEPGLDKFFNKTEKLRQESLGPLISWALTRIPVHKHSTTPIFLFATAGLRRMRPEDSHWVLDSVRDVLSASPFYFEPRFARIISGSDEATFGWVALNFVRGTLSSPNAGPTFGALDLGGSSMEITFEVPKRKATSVPTSPVSLGPVNLSVYARSFEGYGMNDAFDWTVGMLLSKKEEGQTRRLLQSEPEQTSSSEKRTGTGVFSSSTDQGRRQVSEDTARIEHPCIHKGNTVWHMHRGQPASEGEEATAEKVMLVGNPNVEECAKLAHAAVFRGAQGGKCSPPECILGAHEQPAFEGTFFALAGFHIVAHFFFESFLGDPKSSSSVSQQRNLAAVLERGAAFCMRPWEEVRSNHGHIKGADMNCFRAPYTVALLREGLGLREDQLVLAEGGGLSWTLGAALLEGMPVVKELKSQKTAQQVVEQDDDSAARGVSADSLFLGGLFNQGISADFPAASQASFALFLAMIAAALFVLLIVLSLIAPHLCPWVPRLFPSRWLALLPRGLSDGMPGSSSPLIGKLRQQPAAFQHSKEAEMRARGLSSTVAMLRT